MFLDDTYHVFDLDKKAKGSALIEVRLVFFMRYIGDIEDIIGFNLYNSSVIFFYG